MAATEIGKAYVQIIPKAEGISGAITSELGGEAEKAGNGAGLKLVGALKGVIGAAAIGKFLGDSITTGMDFDKSISQVAATMGLTMDEMKAQVGEVSTAFGDFSGNLREYAQFMGANTAFSASQAADALNYMALAGYDVQTSMDMLPNVLNLAAAGGMELATASDMITDASSALGLSLDETALMVDKMAKAASKSNTSVAQLGDAILAVGGTAKGLKGGTTELSQVLGIMADNGIKGAEAGTHLRNIMLSMTPKSEAAAKAMEQIGLQAYDSMGELRPLGDVFQELSASLDGMSSQARTEILSAMFNKTDLATVNALLATTGERWDELSLAIDGAWYSESSLNDALQKTGLSTADMQKKMKALGVSEETFNQILNESAGNASDFADFLWEATDAETSYDDVVNALGGDLELLQGAFDNTTGAAQAMADTQLDNLSGDITLMKSAFEGVQIALSDFLAPVLREVTQLATDFLSALTSALTNGDFSGFEQIGQNILDKIQSVLIGKPDRMMMGMELVTGFLEGITSKFPDIMNKGIEVLSNIITGIISKIPDLITTAGELVRTLITFLADNAPTFLKGGMDLLMNIVQGILDNLPAIIDATVDLIGTLLDTLIENLPKIVEMGYELVTQLIVGLIKALPDIVAGAFQLIGGIADTFSQYNWLDIGINLVQGIINGILSMASAIWDAAKSVAQSAFNAACDALGIASPAKKGIYIGEMLDEGFALGVENKMGLVDDAVSELADTSVSTLTVANSTEFNGGNASNNWEYLFAILGKYLPEISEREGINASDLYNGLNRQLGWAVQ